MDTWHNDRIVWGPVLVARCVKCALHVHVVEESVNEVVINVTRCMTTTDNFGLKLHPYQVKHLRFKTIKDQG